MTKPLSEIIPIVESYFFEIQKILSQKNLVFINFDEVAIFFEMNKSHTLEVSGTSVIGIRSYGKDKERITVIPTVCSDGTIFPFIVILKSKNKKLNNKNFPLDNFHPHIKNLIEESGTVVVSNSKAWNNGTLMKDIIIPFFKSYVLKYFEGKKKCIFVFDNCSSHIKEEILDKFQELGKLI